MNNKKIISYFGADFHAKAVNDLAKYKNLWGLSDFEQIDYYSVNCIFKCSSSKHGLCILKIGNDAKSTENEFNILTEYKNTAFCEVYESDIIGSVLLIEFISPGTQLRAVPDLDKRLDIFSVLGGTIHKKPASKKIYPTYMGWVSRITNYMRARNDYELLCVKMIKAEQICHTLCQKYPGEMLLHGDLHHDNILLGANNRYRIIDPKGVVGDPVFDIPRFILNEFDDELDDNFYPTYTHITKTLSVKFNIPEVDIRKLVYVEMCMANCWCVESNEIPNINDVLFTEKLMEEWRCD